MVLSDSICQDFPESVISTGAYIVFNQGGTIYNWTHVPGTVSKYGANSEYSAACTTWMSLAHLIMINNDLLNKYPYVVPEQAPFIILYRKSYICMAKNGQVTKHTRHIDKGMHF